MTTDTERDGLAKAVDGMRQAAHASTELDEMVAPLAESFSAVVSAQTERDRLQFDLKLAVEALEFYANRDNWKWIVKPTDIDHILYCGSEVQRDFGQRADTTLSRLSAYSGKTEKGEV